MVKGNEMFLTKVKRTALIKSPLECRIDKNRSDRGIYISIRGKHSSIVVSDNYVIKAFDSVNGKRVEDIIREAVDKENKYSNICFKYMFCEKERTLEELRKAHVTDNERKFFLRQKINPNIIYKAAYNEIEDVYIVYETTDGSIKKDTPKKEVKGFIFRLLYDTRAFSADDIQLNGKSQRLGDADIMSYINKFTHGIMKDKGKYRFSAKEEEAGYNRKIVNICGELYKESGKKTDMAVQIKIQREINDGVEWRNTDRVWIKNNKRGLLSEVEPKVFREGIKIPDIMLIANIIVGYANTYLKNSEEYEWFDESKVIPMEEVTPDMVAMFTFGDFGNVVRARVKKCTKEDNGWYKQEWETIDGRMSDVSYTTSDKEEIVGIKKKQ